LRQLVVTFCGIAVIAVVSAVKYSLKKKKDKEKDKTELTMFYTGVY